MAQYIKRQSAKYLQMSNNNRPNQPYHTYGNREHPRPQNYPPAQSNFQQQGGQGRSAEWKGDERGGNNPANSQPMPQNGYYYPPPYGACFMPPPYIPGFVPNYPGYGYYPPHQQQHPSQMQQGRNDDRRGYSNNNPAPRDAARPYEQRQNNYQPRSYQPQQRPEYQSRNEQIRRQYPRKTEQVGANQQQISPQKRRNNYDQERQQRQYTPYKSSSALNSQKQFQHSSNSSLSQSEEQQIFYRKKVIAKRKDPVLDSREQIRKWVQARRRNYPRKGATAEEKQARVEQGELSILERKIRQKITLINADARSILKKQKDLDILRRFILYPRRPRKENTVRYQRNEGQPLVQEILEEQPAAVIANEEPLMEGEAKQVEEIAEGKREVQKEKANILEMGEDKQILVQKDVQVQVQKEEQGEEVVQVPIKSGALVAEVQQQPQRRWQSGRRRQQLSVDVIVKHLQMKQREDSKLLQNLMDYKSNSFNYRYQHQTLETNLLLDNIFRDTSYLLQTIRFVVKNNFFD